MKKRAVKMLLSGKSRADVIKSFGIHAFTLNRWLNRYNESGDIGLLDQRMNGNYKLISGEVEQRIVLIKERYPAITVRQARFKLKKEGVNCAESSIWRIWVKYGMAGLNPQSLSLTFSYGQSESSHILYNKKLVIELLKQERYDEAADIVNNLPLFPYRELLAQIPETYLNPFRQRDLLSYYLTDPGQYYIKAHRLRKIFEHSERYYSALICGINELLALQWLGRVEQGVALINHLRQILGANKPRYFSFIFDLFEGVFLCTLLKVEQAIKMMKRCEGIQNLLMSPFLKGNLANLCAFLGYNRKAIYYLEGCIKELPVEKFPIFYLNLALCYCRSGDYRSARNILARLKGRTKKMTVHALLVETRIMLVKGNFFGALKLCRSVLRDVEKGEIPHYIHAVTLMESAIYSALSEKKKAQDILQRYDSYLFKHKLYREFEMRKILEKSSPKSKNIEKIKVFHLFSMLKKAKGRYLSNYYMRAVRYAERHSISGFLHLFGLFYPEPVKNLLKKGKNPHLPVTMLEFPVFEQAISSYRISFLGQMRIYKDGKKIRQKIPPRVAALFIHLALTAEGYRTVEEFCMNFWPRSERPRRNLSRLLSSLRKFLGTSKRYLKINQGKIVFSHFLTTDYSEFEMALSKAKVFERTGEWTFARKEYLYAFSLFRGEPFKKMYDNWSENIRRVILNKLETEVVHFAKQCVSHNDRALALKVMKRVSKIIPSLC
ncbi:hypothetical protein BXT86_00675 [candidate division WOR-3 bacterium 4484_100]|uniref:Bacterial transcriptional activator domain-containing protein n=1 Tax=candidate division WOR-3 bacterium 4484_100 TaxID=1936077 RepID=A0A1V4QGQ3_UNCW3|nr:MAG: hypothetical protein BXT86_00675 [candidate division WOR-3 bacterium 4484_100]